MQCSAADSGFCFQFHSVSNFVELFESGRASGLFLWENNCADAFCLGRGIGPLCFLLVSASQRSAHAFAWQGPSCGNEAATAASSERSEATGTGTESILKTETEHNAD